MPSTKRSPKPDWDTLVARYCTRDFISHDPIAFPHAYRQDSKDWRDAECVAFLSAMFSYGRRDTIQQTLRRIFQELGPHPATTLAETSPSTWKHRFRSFYYRFNTATDLVFLLSRLGEIYQDNGSLKAIWALLHQETGDIRLSIHRFRQIFLQGEAIPTPDTYGITFLFADPMRNSAAKRFNMLLRWLVRQDEVDLGLWQDVTSPAELMIPLDTHVATMARYYRITQRQSNDWKTVEEITRYFRRLCPADPVRYDFALFGLGMDSAQGSNGHRPISDN